MTATINRTTAPPVPLDEVEAAKLEGLAPMPSDLLALRERKLALKQAKDDIEDELNQIKATFDARLQVAGVVGFTLGGKVKARRTEYDTVSLDMDGLRTAHPRIFARFRRTTPSVRINIT
jgi:hypothetical protein